MTTEQTQTVTRGDRRFRKFSRDAIHGVVARLLRDEPRGRLLDMPAGSGALSYALQHEGFEVTACDIHPENFEPSEEIPVVNGDLSERFPFDDAAFDVATFIDGPEHVANPFAAFREFGRVVRPGGLLVVTIPNYSNLESRLKLLMYGTVEKVVSQARLRDDFGGDPAMLHISPLGYAQLRFFLEASGFRIERIDRDSPKPKQWFLLPVAAVVWLVSALRGTRGREKYWLDGANSPAVLMGGNTLVLLARRTDEEVRS